MIAELFYSPGCAKCAAARADLKSAALLAIDDLGMVRTQRVIEIFAPDRADQPFDKRVRATHKRD
jgi:hypothetical protein